MGRLLARLHKWASRQDENFLTESLSCIVEHLLYSESEAGAAFLKWLTGGAISIKADEADAVDVSTQYATPAGTPDIVIRSRESRVYIEAKVDSGFGANQLERYRADLNTRSEKKKALITLTRYPIDLKSCIPVDQERRWYEIADTLRELQISDPVSLYLISELLELFRFRGVAMESVSWQLPEGIRSLRNCMTLLEEALNKTGISIHQRSAAWDWYGFYLEKKKYYVGIKFDDPTVVRFSTEDLVIKEKDVSVPFGVVEEGWWRHYLNLDSEDIHFFALSRPSQLICLVDFLTQCKQSMNKLEGSGH